MSTTAEPARDPALGRALRELAVPEHAPGFADRLHALLVDEATAQPAARPRRPAIRVPLAALRVAAGAALAVVLVVVLAVGPGGRSGRVGPQTASAADIVLRAQDALASTRALQAVLISRERMNAGNRLSTSRLRVALDARGNLRVLGDPRNGDTYYSAARGRQVQLRLPYGERPFVTTGVAPGAPDAVVGDGQLALETGAVTRALVAARDAHVTTERLNGRAVWTLRTAVPVNKLGFSGDRLLVSVDRRTGFPVRVRETFRGRIVREFTLRSLRLLPSIRPRVFSPRVPSNAQTFDGGFRRTALHGAARRVGYAPLAPRSLPSGFVRAETSTARTTLSATGDEAMNPPSVDVVSTAYRRGLDHVVVSTRRTGARPSAWADPVAAGEGNAVTQERFPVRAGALKGAVARLVINPRVEPHAWAVTDHLVVTITGALTRDQLVRAVESLQRVR